MSSGITRLTTQVGAILRDTLGAFRGVRPADRSADGTFGTQRMYSRQLDEQRRERYPRD